MTASGSSAAAVAAAPALERSDILRTASLLNDLGERDRSRIVAQARIIEFKQAQVLFLQGEPVKNLALIATGKVKLLQASAKGDEVLMWASAPGDVLGLMAGHRSALHTCTARVLERGEAWVWNRNQVDSLLTEYPQLGVNLARILSSRLAELEERFREVSTEPVLRRIALVLLRLSSTVGIATGEGINVRLSREDLAKMTGTTLFTVSRVISRWAEQGVILARRSAVIITNRKLLEWIALRGQ